MKNQCGQGEKQMDDIAILNNKTARNQFAVLAVTACIANTIGFASNAVLFGHSLPTIVCFVCAIIMVLLFLYGRKDARRHRAAAVILIIINLFEFPYLYYIYRTSTLVYMVLGIVGIIVVFHKKTRAVSAIGMIILDVIWILWCSGHAAAEEIPVESAFGALLCSFVIVCASVSALLIQMDKQYEIQRQTLIDMTEQLKSAADRDALTKLYNRRYLASFLDQKVANDKEGFTVVLLDLDDFKAINDTYGHVFGDKVLQSFAAILEQEITDKGIAARYGGEEFMLVFEESDISKIEQTMENIREAFDDFSQKEKGKRFTFSGGVEVYHHEDRVTMIFNAADDKLYRAKSQGKNRVIC